MRVPARPCPLVPAIAIAALALGDGCVSAFTDGASEWTPADGKPTCRPEAGIAVDAAITALGVYAMTRFDAFPAACAGGLGICVVAVSLPFAIAGGGAIGVGGGVYKSRSCGDARRRWNAIVADQAREDQREDAARPGDMSLDAVARELGGAFDAEGDTLVLRAPNVDVCTSPAWRHQVRGHRQELIARGLTRLSCRLGDAVVWEGSLEGDD